MFLGPDPDLLKDWGALNQYKVREQVQLWRFLTNVFLTPGFMVWGTNSFLLMLIGFMVESEKLGQVKMIALYISIAVFTSFFTATVDSYWSCGNIGVISGLTFAMLAQLILNWKALAKVGNGSFRIIMIFLPVILFIFTLMVSFVGELDRYFRQ